MTDEWAARMRTTASFLALRAEVYPAPVDGRWVWRITEPRPGRVAVIRRMGFTRSRLAAVVRAAWALWRYPKGGNDSATVR